jgi:anti-anti-sigma regulatory factor
MQAAFKKNLLQTLQNDASDLIDEWLTLFEGASVQEAQHRYYADFLAFFEECVEEDLQLHTDSSEAMKSFLKKLSEIIGEDEFFDFKESVYSCYLKFPIFHAIERKGDFSFENIKPMASFFESLTSHVILSYVQDKRQRELSNINELNEREAPMSEIWDGVLMVSIVGTLDSNRILKIIDKVLQKLETDTIDHVIIDIGAIFDINSEVTAQIIKLKRAIDYMGCQSYLSGINQNIAKNLTNLDIHMGIDKTYRSTKQALATIIKE